MDIERIEVLKGPQGTLYGSGSLAGTLRYIPVSPNLEEFEGFISTEMADVSYSDDISASMKGAINMPIIRETLALRLSAYHFEDAGVTDAIGTELIASIAEQTDNKVRLEKDADSSTTTGLRAQLLWSINGSS